MQMLENKWNGVQAGGVSRCELCVCAFGGMYVAWTRNNTVRLSFGYYSCDGFI